MFDNDWDCLHELYMAMFLELIIEVAQDRVARN
jgi:hypothetical protein